MPAAGLRDTPRSFRYRPLIRKGIDVAGGPRVAVSLPNPGPNGGRERNALDTNERQRQNANSLNIESALLAVGAPALLFTMSACSDDAEVASENLSKAADNFEVNRRIVMFNGITNDYLLTVEGACSIEDEGKQLEVICKTGPGTYKKHFLGLSDNVTYFVEQIDAANVSAYHYRVVFKPQAIIPDIDLRTDVEELTR